MLPLEGQTSKDMVRRQIRSFIKYFAALLALMWAGFAWSSNDIQLLVWGCGPLTARRQCVFAVRTTETTSIFINRAPPRHPAWCTQKTLVAASEEQQEQQQQPQQQQHQRSSVGGVHHETCRALQRSGRFEGLVKPKAAIAAVHTAAVKAAAAAASAVASTAASSATGVAAKRENKKKEAGGLVGGGDSISLRRACVEWLYACDGTRTLGRSESNVTVWYHHFHKVRHC